MPKKKSLENLLSPPHEDHIGATYTKGELCRPKLHIVIIWSWDGEEEKEKESGKKDASGKEIKRKARKEKEGKKGKKKKEKSIC